jgi:hypothetical protein
VKRVWLTVTLLAPLGCRGEFDISQYLADDTAGTGSSENESSTEMDTNESPDSESESAESESVDTSTSTDTESESVDETETSTTCLPDQVDLGVGCFGVRTELVLDITPTDIALADFTGEGTIDLILAGSQFRFALGDPIDVFLGLGPLQNLSGDGVAVGYLNADDIVDFAAIGPTIELQLATMGFGFMSDGNLPAAGFDGVIVDLENDGDSDVVVSGTTLRSFQADFGMWTVGNDLGYAGQRVRAANFDADNDVDIALAMPGSDSLAVFENASDGVLNTPTQVVIPGIGDIEVGEFGGDELPDVLALSTTDDTLSICGVEASFMVVEISTHPVGSEPRGLALGDLDGDGLLDAATANFSSADISLLLGDAGTLTPEIRFPLPSRNDHPTLIAAADLDNDSRVELVVTAPAMGRVLVLGLIP